jgi:hypothetical protein
LFQNNCPPNGTRKQAVDATAAQLYSLIIFNLNARNSRATWRRPHHAVNSAQLPAGHKQPKKQKHVGFE